jgi:chaperonin GroEL
MKEIRLGSHAREGIKEGIDKAARAVTPTLGVVGMSALIDWEGLDPIVSDDGVTILKNLEFEDKFENMGLKMLRKAAVRTSVEGGDGTATTTVLTQALVGEAFKLIGEDSSKIQDVKLRLIKGRDEVLDKLSELKRNVKPGDIEAIANISSLDKDVAKLISDIVEEVGVNGVVTVEKSPTLGYSKEVVKGMRIDSGLVSPYFVNDLERMQCALEDPAIVIVDRKVSTNSQIQGIMNDIGKNGKYSVLWVADDVDSLALASLVLNSQQGTFKVACIKNPYTSSRAKDFLSDLANMTGGTVVSEEAGMKLEDADYKMCGHVKKVIVTKDACTIIGGVYDPAAYQTYVAAIENTLKQTVSEYEKTTLRERLAQLTNGIGVIRVGTYTDVDFNFKKMKFENAINATQAALQEGIVAGGGVALCVASGMVEDEIFKMMLTAPFNQMVKNANVILPREAVLSESHGIDFRTKQFVDMFEAGIIDPFKVLRLAIESAVSITLNLITTETAIVNVEPVKSEISNERSSKK